MDQKQPPANVAVSGVARPPRGGTGAVTPSVKEGAKLRGSSRRSFTIPQCGRDEGAGGSARDRLDWHRHLTSRQWPATFVSQVDSRPTAPRSLPAISSSLP